jgi:hypothetical protein
MARGSAKGRTYDTDKTDDRGFKAQPWNQEPGTWNLGFEIWDYKCSKHNIYKQSFFDILKDLGLLTPLGLI